MLKINLCDLAENVKQIEWLLMRSFSPAKIPCA
jgi:hypothetical protein